MTMDIVIRTEENLVGSALAQVHSMGGFGQSGKRSICVFAPAA